MCRVYYACEDVVSENILRRILHAEGCQDFFPLSCRGGNTEVMKKLHSYQKSATALRILVLMDLDNNECAPSLIAALPGPPRKSKGYMLRVAVREAEAWLIADRRGIADFLGISLTRVPKNPESLENPKQTLVNLARKSRKRDIKNDLVPTSPAAIVGPDYNNVISDFITKYWNLDAATGCAPSLAKTRRAVHRLLQIQFP